VGVVRRKEKREKKTAERQTGRAIGALLITFPVSACFDRFWTQKNRHK